MIYIAAFLNWFIVRSSEISVFSLIWTVLNLVNRSNLFHSFYFILLLHLFLPINESVYRFFNIILAKNLLVFIPESFFASTQRVVSDRILTSICFSKMSLPFLQDLLWKISRVVEVLRKYAAFPRFNIRSWFRLTARIKPFYPGTLFAPVYTSLYSWWEKTFFWRIDLDASALIQGDSATKRPNSFQGPQTVPDKWFLKWYPSLTFYVAT